MFGVTDYVDKIHTLHYGVCVAKEPRNDYDIAACRRLGLRLAEWTAVFVDNKKELHPLLTTKKVDGREVEEADAKPPKATAAKSNKESETSVVPTATVPTAEGHEGPVHLIVRITVPVRNQTAWKLTVRELEKYSRQEPGCVRYHFGQIEGSETEFYVIEEYTSVEALNIHSNSPYFQALVPALGKMSSTLSVEKVFPINPQPIVAKSTGLDATTLVVGVCLGLGLGFAVNKLLSSN